MQNTNHSDPAKQKTFTGPATDPNPKDPKEQSTPDHVGQSEKAKRQFDPKAQAEIDPPHKSSLHEDITKDTGHGEL